MSEHRRSVPRSWETKTLVWSCLGSVALGAVLLYGAGFYWLGQWQTGEQALKRQSIAACMQDFLLQPDRDLIYTKLKDTTSSYQRRQLIRERKLATISAVAALGDHQTPALDPSRLETPTAASADHNTPACAPDRPSGRRRDGRCGPPPPGRQTTLTG
jgi:hypothetical protein